MEQSNRPLLLFGARRPLVHSRAVAAAASCQHRVESTAPAQEGRLIVHEPPSPANNPIRHTPRTKRGSGATIDAVGDVGPPFL